MSTGWRVPIRMKLLAVLAVPVLGYVIIATMAVLRAQRAADDIRDQVSVVTTAVGPTSLSTSLIDERTITALERAGLEDDLTLRIESSADARRATDQQLSALQTLMRENRDARGAYAPAVDGLARGLESLRAEIDAGDIDDAGLFARYSELIDGLTSANESAVDRIDDRELWQGAKLSELATRQKDTRGVLINALIPVGRNDDAMDREQSVQISRALSAYESRNAAIEELATGRYARAASVLFEALEAADLSELAQDVLETGTLDSSELYDVASYKGGFVYEAPTGDYIHDSFRANVAEIVEGDATHRSDVAAGSLRVHALAGLAGLAVTALVSWLVVRSITRPLHSLTRQAIETAQHRLPETVHEILETPLGENVVWPQLEPIRVKASDEVADVANALTTMQDSALSLAVEEAILRRHITDILTSLGQRNQTLVTRQLDFITDLERDETDPDILGNLFYLDHLATRMRRNAESLLVLAGIDPPRKWVGPASVSDVIRAGLGEAEEYKRVRVQEVEPATIAGSATTELAHLLAELIENALVFSTNDQVVEISGRYRSSENGVGGGDGYTLTIRDFGVGMSPEELAQANRRLAGTESYTIAPSKYMGHYVAGKLAARNGITVRLHESPGRRGITATVDIPPSLLTAEVPADRMHLPPLPEGTPVPMASTPLPVPPAGPGPGSGPGGPGGPGGLGGTGGVGSEPGSGDPGALDEGELEQLEALESLEALDDLADTEEMPEVPVGAPTEFRAPAAEGLSPESRAAEGVSPEHRARAEGRAPDRRAEGRAEGRAQDRRAAARSRRSAEPDSGGGGRSRSESGSGSGSRSRSASGSGSGSGQAQGNRGNSGKSDANSGSTNRKPRKPRKRGGASTKLPVKLPVPPPSQPLEASSDDD